MFNSTWTWVLPLVLAAAAFVAVLATTPPGFGALLEVVFGSPRGVNADAAAYAIGAAASLALVVLIVVAAITSFIEFVRRRTG